jgi:hypothetical protein
MHQTPSRLLVRRRFINNCSEVQIHVIAPVIYSRQMSELTPPRSFRATLAAILAIVTGGYWVALSAPFLVWGLGHHLFRHTTFLRTLFIVLTGSFITCMGIATVIVGVGVWNRRDRARIFAIALAGLWILAGLLFFEPFLRLPASAIHVRDLAMFLLPALEVVAPFAWLVLLIGKRVRAEFLPPAMVQIYVNLLHEGTPCARPTQALILGNGLFELLPTGGYDPKVEHWEFRPGSIVRGKETRGDGEPYLLATSFES